MTPSILNSWTTLTMVSCCCLLVACDGDDSSRGPQTAEPETGLSGVPASQPFDTNARESAEVLSAADGDTVWAWPTVNTVSTIVWTTEGGVERWRSQHAYDVAVTAEINHIDGDSLLDLFWTIDHDDIVGGAVLLASDRGAEVAYSDWSGNCSAPELWRSVHGDSLTDIVTYIPTPFGPQSCFQVDYSQCVEQYPTSWAKLLVQTPQGFVEDSTEAINFHSQMAYRYSQASVRLQRVLQLVNIDSAYFQYKDAPCTMDMRWVMDSMAIRAYMLGNPAQETRQGAP